MAQARWPATSRPRWRVLTLPPSSHCRGLNLSESWDMTRWDINKFPLLSSLPTFLPRSPCIHWADCFCYFAFETCSLGFKPLNAAHFLSSFFLTLLFCPFLFNSSQNLFPVFLLCSNTSCLSGSRLIQSCLLTDVPKFTSFR